MPAHCNPDRFHFEAVSGRRVEAAFDGGVVTSDAGGLLMGLCWKALSLPRRFAACFFDKRDPDLIEHSVETLLRQRVMGLAMGYEDLNDHDVLRHDPVLALLAEKLEAHMAVAERFRRLGRVGRHEDRIRMRQVHRKEVDLAFNTANHPNGFAEVGLGVSWRMRQWHEHLLRPLAPARNVVLHNPGSSPGRSCR